MTKFKKLMALAAVSMLGIQIMGAGTAFAANGDECDFGSDNLEITIDTDDVTIRLNDGILECDDTGGGFQAVDETLPISAVDSITVEMDDDESNADFVVLLDDAGSPGDAAEWEAVDTFDVDITTTFVVDGSGITDDVADRLSIRFGASTFSFSGISGTYSASDLDLKGGADKDLIDASKATVKVTADGGAESDVIKGGTRNDSLDDDSDDDIVYGNGGNDEITAGYQGWGGEGHDDITVTAGIAAPGAGDDDVVALIVTYADLTDGIEWTNGVTGGAAGDDDVSGYDYIYGSQGDDVILDDDDAVKVRGYGGDDVIKTDADRVEGGAGDDLIVALDYDLLTGQTPQDEENAFYGNAGDDVLKGKNNADTLAGGPGKDQAWGGNGSDTCNAEVTNRCEFGKV